MNKGIKLKKLNRPKEHRELMLKNLVTSLFYNERISTTTARTKEARRLAERLITQAKKSIQKLEGSDYKFDQLKKVNQLRRVNKFIQSKEVLYKLFHDIAPRYLEREGGYTRIIKIGKRNSDNSEMAFLELVDKKSLFDIKEYRNKIRSALQEKKKKTAPEPKKEKKNHKEKEPKEV